MSRFLANLTDRLLTRRRVLIVAVVASVATFSLVASSFLPGAPYFPDWLIWLVFPPLFVVHSRTVLVSTRRSARRSALADELRSRPRPLLALAALLAAFAGGIGMYSILTATGVPERHDHTYYLRNHTDLTRVSYSTYRHAIAVDERIFGGIAAVFYLMGVIINTQARAKRPSVSNRSISAA